MNDEVVDGFVEISLKSPEDFLKIKETLTRVGVSSKDKKKLYQTCHILHKQGKYYIVHFKEMFLLDGKEADLSEEDVARRNRIIALLKEWDIIDGVDLPEKTNWPWVTVIPFNKKSEWELISKYTVGNVSK